MMKQLTGSTTIGKTLLLLGITLVVFFWPSLSRSLPREHTARDGSRMVLVPAGTFRMSPSPGREIHIDSFYIDEREITQAQYQRFVLDTGRHPPGKAGFAGKPYRWTGRRIPEGLEEHPIVGITWEEANSYCRWAVKRLPTEAEWEKAARGTDGRTYPWGSTWTATRLNSAELWAKHVIQSLKDYDRFYWWPSKKNWEGRVVQTKPVGSFPGGASTYGALDMAGNVAEWVADWFDMNYPLTGPTRNPVGPASGTVKVVRGGAYSDPRWKVTATFRGKAEPEKRLPTVGFRCARTP
jgi:formylglycine-generating enzyme required for sulfatase activity